ncbi:MAG: autotransporter outer membrane beta-barrel domain-containing protein [Ancylobacter novellus]|uniref:Autotransporter outer membrane beta-barrel domain-containing protein n=1 Tax=Ancylobacter novellus TaxID=921 RepID=A0A2W5R9R6_ANCNO|nr:MAG: autotransporter outer membrane beta-barrel domain-containing protein [Ancylobacter novellus]
MTVSGVGSSWFNTSQVAIGNTGQGSFTVSDGATATLTSPQYGTYLAMQNGSTGTMTVTGSGTQVTTNEFYVGYRGNGSVTISDGARVTNRTAYVGEYSQSTGAVTVTGAGTVWDTGTFLSVSDGGAGTLTISDGGTVLTNGTGIVGNWSGLQASVTVTGPGSTWNGGNSTFYVGGGGTATLNILNGGSVTSGVTYVGYQNTSGAPALVNVAGAGSAWSLGTSTLYMGTANGQGALSVSGGGVVTVGQIVRQTGGTASISLDGGTLMAAADQANFLSGFASGAIVLLNGGGTIDTDGHAVGISSIISGSGQLTKAGAGTLTLSALNTNTGVTAVSAGTLLLSGRVGGAVDVASGATLTGTGSAAGNVTIRDGGTFLGTSGATFTAGGDLTLETSSIFDLTLLSPTSTAVLSVANATLGGSLNLTPGAGYANGTYRLIDYSGSLTNPQGLVIGTAPAHSLFRVDTSTAQQVNLVVLNGLWWNGTTTLGDGTVHGGTADWDVAAATTNWTNEAGTGTSAWTQDGMAIFAGSAGTVSITGSTMPQAAAMEFLTDGYSLTGGSITLTPFGAGSTPFIMTDTGVTATIGSVLQGSSGLLKTGAGTLVLSGENTYTGGTTISAGTLQIGNGTASGSILGDVVNNATLAFNRSDSVTFSGVISGTGALVQAGTGTVILTGANTYSGGTTVSAGTLQGNTTSLQGNITNNANVAFDQASTGTYAGVISGTGSLTKLGAGTLILTSENTYTGGTTISEGTLQIGNGGTTGSVAGAIVNNAALVFNRSDTYNFPGTITGPGSVTILGGTVNFTSAGGYTGPITVVGANFELAPGAVSGSSYTIENGAVLSGTGTIGGLSVASGGTVSPGYSPGTLTVTGNVAFAAGSTYRVDITPEGAHDLITATGTATISGGTVEVLATPGTYAPGSIYTILTASGGVTGQFASVSANYAYLDPVTIYDANNVYLTILRNTRSFPDAAVTPNQRAAAAGTESLGSGNAVYDAVLQLSNAQAPAAFDSLSGEIYASAATVMMDQSIYLRQAVGMRMRQGLNNQNGAGQATAQLAPGYDATVWAQGFGAWGDTDGNGNAAALDRSVAGAFAGIDAAIAANARVGIVGGYSNTSFSVDARASSGDIDNYDLGLYGGAQFGALSLFAAASYTWHDLSVNRTIAFPGFFGLASSDDNAGTTQVFGEAAWRFDIEPIGIPATALGKAKSSIEPFVNLAYVNLSTDGFTETGTSAALTGTTNTLDTVYSTLGVRAATVIPLANGGTLTPHVSIGWQHAFGDTAPVSLLAYSSGSTPFAVSGVPIAEDSALVGAGFDYAISKTVSAYVTYSGQFANSAQDNAIKGALTVRF